MKKILIIMLIILTVPINSFAGNFKAYTDYRCLSLKMSKQYKLQQKACTDSQGLRRLNNYYMIAIGKGWNIPVGHTCEITLSSGQKLYCVVSDVKQNRHTDHTNRYDCKGGVLEFIVDSRVLPKQVKKLGDISYLGFYGSVVKVRWG